MNLEFEQAMQQRGWHYDSLEELCEEHLRLFLESYRILQLCDQFRALASRTLDALTREHAATSAAPSHFPWDYGRGFPRPEDLS